MELGFIGLGRMGSNMVQRLCQGNHRIVVYDRSPEVIRQAEQSGAIGASSLEEMAKRLAPPRVIWVMVPSGLPVEDTISSFMPLLQTGDTVIDGGNSNYQDSIRRAAMLRERGIHFLDVGTSGGIWGLTEGYSLMIGGEVDVVQRLRQLFETLAPAPEKGWGRVGPNGAGHFVKMVHNGIEYGLMQAYAEGFAIMKAKKEFELDLHAIAGIWQSGSVVRSWLLDLIKEILSQDQGLKRMKPWVDDSGEGRWTVKEAIDLNVSAPVITESLLRRLRSREEDPFTDKLLAAMRQAFGGHAIKGE
ncbi:MAG: phosphogluconate dehydrogenase (NAD(+)-dependent, decarboxylating) [Nitrospirota bacterium]